jgi:hypothetical protein
MLETPVSIFCNGSNNVGFAALAAKSESGNIVRVLISNFDSPYEEFTLVLSNLPLQGTLQAEVYLVDEANDLALVDEPEVPRTGTLIISRGITNSTVYLISVSTSTSTSIVTTTSSTTGLSTVSPQPRTLPIGPAVPGFPIESILRGLLGGLLALTMIRRRRRA